MSQFLYTLQSAKSAKRYEQADSKHYGYFDAITFQTLTPDDETAEGEEETVAENKNLNHVVKFTVCNKMLAKTESFK